MLGLKKNSPKNIRELMERLESRQFLSASALITVSPSLKVLASASSSSSVSGYTPAQIKSAYGISSINFGGVVGDGSQQTIAIVDAYSDPNILSDLKVFDKQFSLNDPTFTQESQTGSTTNLPTANAGWAQEISLDVEWAHAIAPKANIILVDASTDSIKNLMAAVNYARNISTVSVVSMSWGTGDFPGETSYDKYFTTPTGHIGVTFVSASGDQGAAGGAEYPASSPNVLSVGGTTLSISSSGAVTSESAWSGVSGGVSRYESTPSYQSGVSTSGRSTPDVSYDANPDTGIAVYDSFAYEGTAGWSVVGGTSTGAPQWAALVAIADQGRVINGGSSLDGATGTLPAIYSIYSNAASYSADFTDITSGSSPLGGGFGGFGFGGFGFGRRGGFGRSVSARTGYDTLTGLGTPKAASLVAALSTVKVSSSVATKTTVATAAAKTKLKAAVVVATPETVTYQNLSRPGMPFAANTPDPTAELEAIEALRSTPLSPLESGLIVTDAATAARRGTLTALSGYLTVPLATQVSPVQMAGWTRMMGTASKAMTASVDAVRQIAGDLATAGAPMMDVSRELAAIGRMDLSTSLREAIGSSAERSSAMPPSVRGQSSSVVKLVAGAVAAGDLVLLGYYLAKRTKRQSAASHGQVFNDGTPIE